MSPVTLPALAGGIAIAGGIAAGGVAKEYPDPGPWDGRAWAGAAIYCLLFLAALAGILVLLRGAPPEGDPR